MHSSTDALLVTHAAGLGERGVLKTAPFRGSGNILWRDECPYSGRILFMFPHDPSKDTANFDTFELLVSLCWEGAALQTIAKGLTWCLAARDFFGIWFENT